jgi:shikimate dehydrogenase
MTDKYAVIGNPIAHSKSPLIHKAFAKQFKIKIDYDPKPADVGDFESKVRELIAQGYKGANVTAPFKLEAFALCNGVLSSVALSTGSKAVNTLTFLDDGRIHGHNTDGIGLRNDIEQNLKFPIADKNILILGAGGAAEGVLSSLSGAGSRTIVNRTLEKAQQMVARVSNYEVGVKTFEALNTPYDLIINATSAGLNDATLPLPDIVFGKNCLAYEMVYGRETPFMKQARENGAQVADGLGMLVEQAAVAFQSWHNKRPETAPVIAMLRSAN